MSSVPTLSLIHIYMRAAGKALSTLSCGVLSAAAGSCGCRTARRIRSVSYTHLDVYKRQLHYMTQYVENHTRIVELYVELEKTQIKTLIDFIKGEGYKLISIERRPEEPLVDGDAVLRINIDQGRKFNHRVIVQDVMDMEGVHYVEELG